jgi:lysophospholipase L1-like esterase
MNHDSQIPLEDHHVGLLDAEDVAHERIELTLDDVPAAPLSPPTFGKLSWATATLALCIALTYLVPGLSSLQPWRLDEEYVPFWNLVGRELMGQGAAAAEQEDELRRLEDLARRELREDLHPPDGDAVAPPTDGVYPPYAQSEDDRQALDVGLEFGDRLDPFYAALTRTDLRFSGAITRVSHWGDSVLGTDGITSAIRHRMQARFGDAGHGFHSLTRYDPSYRHKGIKFKERVEWTRCRVSHCKREDGRYGYGGIVVGSGAGSESRLATAQKGAFGRSVSRFELWYLAKPDGGNIEISVDGEPAQTVRTAAEAHEDRWALIEVPDGAHKFTVRAAGGGRVRAYGVTLERDGPGVVWDGMALIGSWTRRLRKLDPEHWASQLQHRQSNLLVYTFGGNDMTRAALLNDMQLYEDEYAEVVRRGRQARPEAACLILSVIDHGERRGKQIFTRPIVPKMVEAQRAVALREGCAFLDLYAAMGGEGSMGRWYRSTPPLGSPDLSHPTAAGHKVIGELVYRALMHGYAEFRQRVQGDPLP